MYRNTDKKAYGIYKRIMYDARYRPLAKEFTESMDRLQSISQTFSKEQWQAIKNYQEASMNLHNAMLDIALRKRTEKFPPKGKQG